MRTDRHDEANSRFSQFCRTRLKMRTIINEQANKPDRCVFFTGQNP